MRTGRALVPAAVLVLGAALGAGCGSDQDPGVPAGEGPTTTSATLAPCPEGGPDASTPAAGCLDEDGTVLRP